MCKTLMSFNKSTLAALLPNKTQDVHSVKLFGQHGIVLQDSILNQIAVFKGAVETNEYVLEGPVEFHVIEGEVKLKLVKLFNVDAQHIGQIEVQNMASAFTLNANDRVSVEGSYAINLSASSDAIWLINLGKSTEQAHRIRFDANHLTVKAIEYRYQRHERLLNFINLLTLYGGKSSLTALIQLSRSSLFELAWQAIEGIHSRSPERALALLKQYQLFHANAHVSHKAIEHVCSSLSFAGDTL
ncbi:hypothetical protein NI389_04215 [Pseudoalteromonas xiamenensis]|uniref:hypothetical protein n=1 Tax=Pseudoalteromonas xiamenensis TaxID=882626 RepID=UPI0027E492C5|nr:hypothetical protein [Pseudoalteromonas xiamenensis]WMN60618.1 hypothetical protein NI389_04215 [Pseudoalteromonas xiamenensis]